MCGILGGTNKRWDYQSAITVLRHRGPDSQNVVSLDDVVLGFARLSIIDLSRVADQPMVSNGGDVWIVFNGEIYDFMFLKKELINRGAHFKTNSDTEVLLNAYKEWGDQFVDHIDGMFAVAIFDKRINKLKLFRDRVGIKPLYYYYDGSQFAFSSELKGIEKLLENETLNIDTTAVYDYLTYLYIPEPKTLYNNVYKLPPAHKLTYDLSTCKITGITHYWELPIEQRSITADQASEQLRDLIAKSVKSQMVSDVPVGFFLSGGMDSSVVVAEASINSRNIKTFSIGFDKQEHSELEYAKVVAEHYRTDHRVNIVSFYDIENLFDRLKHWYDEPFADTSAFPSYRVSELAKQNVTVVLTGDGGDEVFGGYRWYQRFLSMRGKANVKATSPWFGKYISRMKEKTQRGSLFNRVLNKAQLLISDDLELYTKLMGGLTSAEKRQYAERLEIPKDYDSYWFFRRYYRDDLSALTRLQYLDFHTYLPGDILTKVDRVTMAVSLEARVPLLGREVIEFSFSLPENIRYYNGELKGILKKAYRDELPEMIIDRGKKGFSIPSSYLNNHNYSKQEQILNKLWSFGKLPI